MASLKDIRRRITSVKNTQQITKAMKMVAAAKLRRAQQASAGARPYAETLESIAKRIIAELAAASPQQEGGGADFLAKLHPLLRTEAPQTEGEETKAKIALVVYTSDRGLCGAYNTNAIRAAYRRYKELTAEANGEAPALIFVGKKGADFFAKRGATGEHLADFWQGKFTTKKSDALADMLMQKFMSGEFSRVEVVYTQFKSAISQTVQVKQVLPMKIEMANDGAQQEFTAPFIYEPSRQEILAALLPKQVRTEIYKMSADSLASEFGARMTSMDNATRNASEMISGLTLQANRVRQAAITKELMEIIGGAEALKG